MLFDENYWTIRYKEKRTGWDLGDISTPLKNYFEQLTNPQLNILIPGGGNGYEASYLFNNGFKNVYLLDISRAPLQNFQIKHPGFPKRQLIYRDFFDFEGTFDLIVEQTFFCALPPEHRPAYVEKMWHLLKNGGQLAGVLFNTPLYEDHPPFGGYQEEYEALFAPYFEFKAFSPCYNSDADRKGIELFINLRKKSE